MPHQHPLTLHQDYPVYNNDDDDNDDDIHRLPTCNACVQFISPPFYMCSQCPKLFLHDCCASLPRVGRYRPAYLQLYLKNRNKSSLVIHENNCCDRLTNGFSYVYGGPRMDVMCTLMPDLITHAAHAKTHVLHSMFVYFATNVACRCCNKLISCVSYNCITCRNFSIHATCARLPATVLHLYDPHPLELVTAPPPHRQSQMEAICVACEQGLDITRWYYGCAECDQTFHVDCVPCLDKLSLIKYDTAEVRVEYHECPLTLVRGHMVRGCRCGRCGEGYREHRDSLAFECLKYLASIFVVARHYLNFSKCLRGLCYPYKISKIVALHSS